MGRRRGDLLLAVVLSVTGHAAVIGGIAAGVTSTPASTSRAPREPSAVKLLGADQVRALLEPALPSARPSLREAAPRAHASELVRPERVTGRAPAPPAAAPAVPASAFVARPELLVSVEAPAPADRLRPPPLVTTPVEEDDAPVEVASSGAAPTTAGDDERALEPLDPAAVLVDRPPLAYPRAALDRGVEGTVSVGLQLAGDGTVARAWLLHGSGSPLLDGAALDNVRRWRFDPATVAGGRRFRQSVRFHLR